MNRTTTLLLFIGLFLLSGNSFAQITWDFIPNDTTINCGESEHFTNTGQPSASTGCAMGGITITFTDVKIQSGACIKDSVITRTWEVTDACAGFETFDQVITIHDTIGPNVICPSDQVLKALDAIDEIIPSYIPITSFDDPCTDFVDLTIIQTPAAGTNLPLGPHNINMEATDLCGNTDDCDFTLWVYDFSSFSMVSFPSDTTVSCEHTLDTALLGTGLATTTCPVETITYSYVDSIVPGVCVGNDTIYRKWTASDICGDSAFYTQKIVTIDDEPPFIACTITDTTCVSLSGYNAFMGDYISTVATLENCSSVTKSQKPIPGAVVLCGYKTVWEYAEDDCGNKDSCSVFVVVGDSTTFGFDEIEVEVLEIYPNPTTGEFNITIPDWNGELQLNILNMKGQLVYAASGLSSGAVHQVALNEQKGIYLVEVLGEGRRIIGRLQIL